MAFAAVLLNVAWSGPIAAIQQPGVSPKSPAPSAAVAEDHAAGPQEPSASPAFKEADLEFFEAKIRPLLAERCFECHGPKEAAPSGGLQLGSRSALLTGGDSGPAIVPGQPAASLLIAAIHYDGLYEMPPDGQLSEDEIALLTRWVEIGAPWPDETATPLPAAEKFDIAERKAKHWCWQPVQNPSVPTVADPAWQPHPIDAFLRARMELEGLSPAPPAAAETLIRRLTYDLTGLPPTPAEVAAFVQDRDPQAYDRLVDRLLASPQFGERWARHWMDLVRYAETLGHEFDYPITEAYQYRDYLIRAFNADVPYNQLVREHIAGDLLPHPRQHSQQGYNESIIATGWWFLGEATHSPVDVRGDEAGRIDNQLDVFGKAFLGLTIACARCHDHMFDPISTEDYYGLAGFLQSSRRQMALLDPDHQIAQAVAQLEEFQQRADEAVHNQRTQLVPQDPRIRIEALQAALHAAWDQRGVATPNAESTTAAPSVADSPASTPDDGSRPLPERMAKSFRDPRFEAPDHPLHFLQLLLSSKESDLLAAKSAVAEQLERQRQQALAAREQSILFADFAHDLAGWFRSGWAFDAAPTTSWRAGGAVPQSLTTAVAGTLSSGRLGGPLFGVLRSPTFVLDKKFIHHRVAGHETQIKLVIDGYTLDTFNALLFNGATVGVDSPQRFVWVTQGQDIGNYLGHTAHLEYIDHSGGAICVDEVRFSDEPHMPALPSPFGLRAIAADWTDLAGLAEYLVTQWQAELQCETPSADAADLWQWGADSGLHGQVQNIDDAPAGRGGPTMKPATVQPAYAKSATTRENSVADVLAEKLQWLQTHRLPAPRMVPAIIDGTGENESVFIRGNHKALGQSAPRQMITALREADPWDVQPNEGSGRLRLADALVDPRNPLTTRVLVNRVWHHLWGRGLVPSVDNFGAMGEVPSHPELLDHLAVRFMQEGWSLKSLIRYIVTSQAYRMDSSADPRHQLKDPGNRWLHHKPVRRLSAEEIRDSILAVAGTLDLTMYGPSVPVHLTPFMQGRGRPGTEGPLDGNGRRSIYIEVRRNFLSPLMLAFDVPTPFSCVGRRGTSNVPSQALILMNNPFVWEQANRWAQRLLGEHTAAETRIEAAFQLAYARRPSADETTELLEFVRQQQDDLRTTGSAESTAELEAWRDVCHILINSKEFYFLQ